MLKTKPVSKYNTLDYTFYFLSFLPPQNLFADKFLDHKTVNSSSSQALLCSHQILSKTLLQKTQKLIIVCKIQMQLEFS